MYFCSFDLYLVLEKFLTPFDANTLMGLSRVPCPLYRWTMVFQAPTGEEDAQLAPKHISFNFVWNFISVYGSKLEIYVDS